MFLKGDDYLPELDGDLDCVMMKTVKADTISKGKFPLFPQNNKKSFFIGGGMGFCPPPPPLYAGLEYV